MAFLRIATVLKAIILEAKVNEYLSKSCLFKGILKDSPNIIIQKLKLNCTIIEIDSFAHGLDSLKLNVSDFIYGTTKVPLKNFDEVVYGPINEGKVNMLSSYKPILSSDIHDGDLMENLGNFKLSTWLIILIFTIGFHIIFTIISKILKERKHWPDNVFTIIAFYFYQLSFLRNKSNFYNWISFLLVLLSFFIIRLYYMNSVQSNLVYIKPPFLINSYQDLISSTTHIPYWFEGMLNDQDFKNAKSGSDKAQIWYKGLNENSRTVKLIDDERFFEVADQMSKYKVVLIGNWYLLQTFRIRICHGKIKLHLWEAVKDHEVQKMGFVYNKFIDKKLKKQIDHWLLKLKETFISSENLNQALNLLKTHSSDNIKCLDNKIKYPTHSDLDQINMKNLKVVLILKFILLIVIGFIFLCTETCMAK